MLKKTTFAISILLLAFTVYSKELSGEGRFYSQKEDSQAFVKKQLLYVAFCDVISKELSSMGLSSALFWEKYNTRFDSSFQIVEDDLKKKYNIDDENVTAKNKLKFKDELRSKKLKLRSKFGRLQKVIKQFTIEKRTRSPKVPNARYIKVLAKVNKEKLNEIFLKFTTQNVGRTFQNIYLSFDFNLDGATWKDVGVEAEADFTSVVSGHWKKWFEDNAKTFIENVYFTDALKVKEIEEHLKKVGTESYKLTNSSFSNTPTVVTTTSQDLVSPENESLNEDIATDSNDYDDEFSEFPKSLWLKLTINIKKKYENEISQQREFEVTGDYLLIELGTSSFLDHQDFERVSKVYSFENPQKLSSTAASFIYSLPLNNFVSLKGKMANIRNSSKKVDLNIENASSLYNVMQIKEILADKGLRFQLRPVFKSFDGENGVLMLNYQGNKDNVQQFISGLNGSTINSNTKLKIDKSSPLLIRLEKATFINDESDDSKTKI